MDMKLLTSSNISKREDRLEIPKQKDMVSFVLKLSNI